MVKKVPPGHNPHKRRGIEPWKVEPIWAGSIVAIIGGGPSLKSFDLRAAFEGHDDVRIIVVNNSWQICPWADLLHFADAEWWKWNREKVTKGWPKDRILCTSTSDVASVNDPRIKRLWRDRNAFTEDPCKVHGWDGGTQATNLALHLGASKVVHFGIDMQPGPKGETQWHREHKRKTRVQNYDSKFKPCMLNTVRGLRRRGVPVVRATEPGLPEIPYQRPHTALTAG